MKGTKIFSKLKVIVPDLYDKNMNRRTVVIGKIKSIGLSKEAIETIYGFIELISKYGIIGKESVEYIFDKDITMKELSERVNGEYNDKHFKSILNKITYDQRKVESVFGRYIIDDLLNDSNIQEYADKVRRTKDELILKDGVQDILTINVRKDIIRSEYDGDFIGKYGDIIYYYSRINSASIERTLYEDEKFSGYFNYINSTSEKSNEALRDKKAMDRILNGDRSILKGNDSIVKSIEYVAVKDSIKNAIHELANRVYSLEISMEYTSKEMKKYINKAMSMNNSWVGNYSGKAVYANDKLMVCTYEDEIRGGKVVDMDRVIQADHERIDLDVVGKIAECKRISIIEHKEFERIAIDIQGLKILISNIEIAYKAIAGKKGEYRVDKFNRYIALRTKNGISIVMNSGEEDNLIIA